MKPVVIAGYCRSPFTLARKGDLAVVRPDDLVAQVVRALVERTKVNAEDIEDLILGCAFPEGEQGLNMARMVGFIADLPLTVGGATVNRFCGSSMQSIHSAAGAIRMGAGDVYVAAGVESMSRVPMLGFNPLPNPGLYAKSPQAYIGMGDTAENIAKEWGISRAEQERFAAQSHQRAAAAQAQGRFDDEIVDIKSGKIGIGKDGCIRPETTAAALAELKPAFSENGTVTAGTSSPLTDGASAVLVCAEDYAEKHGLPMLARIKSISITGCRPEIMGIGPVGASTKALARAGIDAASLDIVELNEAFASQALACVRDLKLDEAKVNIDGGAIALGHPLGATGARIVGKAASLLKRSGGRYALASQCIGGGQGIATILEAI